MNSLFLHNLPERRVHRVPAMPNVTGDQKSGFRLSMSYTDIQADNRLIEATGQWEKAVQPYKEQAFDPRYSKAQAIESFMSRHTPKGCPISELEYKELAEKYDTASRLSK